MSDRKKRPRLKKEHRVLEQKKLKLAAAFVVVVSVAAIVTVTLLLAGLNQTSDAVPRPGGPEAMADQEAAQQTDVFSTIEETNARLFAEAREREKRASNAAKQRYAIEKGANGTFRLSLSEAENFAPLTCQIANGAVEITADTGARGVPISDDAYYYLFELKLYEDGIAEGADPIATVEKDTTIAFQVPLNNREASSRLFSKFTVAILHRGEYLPVSRPQYITNPGALASYNYAGMSHASVKGVLVDPRRVSELTDLGVNYATYNIPLSKILGPTTNGAYPTIGYSYGGKTYNFNGQAIHEYDYIFQILTERGIDIAAILLNDNPGAYPEITHPLARGASTAPYRMFNAEDDAGIMACAAVGNFLANRYSGSGHGNVEFWIIGNEVNARKEWNYMQQVDLQTYTAAYTRAFRVFYNAIKAGNAGAKVYISLDQQWDRNLSSNPDYDARDMLETFAASFKRYGDIDWGLAFHPYSVPVGAAQFWAGHRLVNNTFATSMMTMGNIEVLCSFMSQESMLRPSGGVRSVILSELGFSSSSGEDLQAAAIVYAFHKAQNSGVIEAVMFNRQTDAAEELAQGLALGLNHASGAHKRAYEAFKQMDGAAAAQYKEYAAGIVGHAF